VGTAVIVVDANVVVYLIVEGRHTPGAEAVIEHDQDWRVPPLWASEFRQAVLGHLRAGDLDLQEAQAAMDRARMLLADSVVEVDSHLVLELAASSGRSAYDCEYVAVARSLGVKLHTADRRLAAAFPDDVVLLESVA
jgi:predicted nucleic acid-binding protein